MIGKAGSMGLWITLLAVDPAHAQTEPPPERKWNVAVENRLFGIADRQLGQNSLGIYVTPTADTQATPWLVLGLGLPYEHFETLTPATSLRTVSNGVGLQPFATARMTPNLFISGFARASHLDYSTAPVPGVSAQLDAWRWVGAGNLFGQFRDQGWRFQPSLGAVYGAEQQSAYTNSTGTGVAAQQLQFGRATAGQEIGHGFKAADASWVLEPTVGLRLNYDYLTTSSVVFNGATFASGARGPWSGSAGVGLALETKQGFFARLQASYETIGMTGLDGWLGSMRAGVTF